MSLFNPTIITDQIIIDLGVDADGVDNGCLDKYYDLASNDMVSAAGALGLASSQIAVNAGGDAKSTELQEYGSACVACRALRDNWGVAHGQQDIYAAKLDFYMAERSNRKRALSVENITMLPRSSQPKAYMVTIW